VFSTIEGSHAASSNEIVALAAMLCGLDGLVFTAGIGENSGKFAGVSAKPPAGSGLCK